MKSTNAGILTLLLALSAVGVRAVEPQYRDTHMKIQPKIPLKAYPFSLTDVRLLDGPFKHAMELDAKYLLSLEPDRLLSRFREYAGLKPKAEAYGGWERDTISGHSLGHYLSACSMMYASTGDERFKDKVTYIIDQLDECQKADGHGFIGGMPNGRKVFAEVAAGDIRSQGFDLNGSWVPWYNEHKTMAGLIDAIIYCDNPKAKGILTRLADWAIDTTTGLNDEQWQRMLACEHGGMNDVLADVYALTGETKYLTLSRKFYHKKVLDPLSRREDKLTGIHANTQIPKIIGNARQYELTGDDSLHTIATFFWDTVTKERSYVTGGNSDGEYFSPKEELSKHVGTATCETCNTYNMLKLTRQLFCWDPKAEYADYYERAVYNHILASQHPVTGEMCYFVPLKTGVSKDYNPPFDSFACCVGTGMENHSKYGDSIYFHDGANSLYVNLFIASELSWKARGVKVRQDTQFPTADTSELTLACDKPVKLRLLIRHPYWATAGFTISVNGEAQPLDSTPGSYAAIERKWKTGDKVLITAPMSLRTEAFRDNAQKLALMYGPLVLSAEVDPAKSFPVIVSPPDRILQAVSPTAGAPLTFAGRQAFRAADSSEPVAVSLIPFYKMHDHPYAVYWDTFDDAQWKSKQEEYRAEQAKQRDLEARTVDSAQLGEMQPERDHNVQSEKSHVGETFRRKFREAFNGGWFSLDMKVIQGEPLDLVCTYWGSDRYNREFEIQVDGRTITTQKLEVNRRDVFFDETYPIPADLLTGKSRVTVRFQALPGKTAGGVFNCRVVKRVSPTQ
ncbi:MAG TPA: beta-L-arabinofuranosidase domain-containing protein [Armatimonadota bacterium]